MKKVNDRTFAEEVIERSKKIPVFVVAYARWRLDYEKTIRAISRVAKRWNEYVDFVEVPIGGKIHGDILNPKIKGKHDIVRYPTFMSFKNGHKIETLVSEGPVPVQKNDVLYMLTKLI